MNSTNTQNQEEQAEVSKIIHNPRVRSRARHYAGLTFVLLYLVAVPSLAFAGGPITDLVDWVVDLLTNGIARGVAIAVLAVLGYMAWAGQLAAGVVVKFIVGIVFVFGGAAIVDLLSAAAT